MLLKKIVVAEDDDAIAHMVSMALGDAGFLCLRASDGEEALNLVRLHTPDLLVLDVMMPRMDGMEVARRLKGDVLLSKTPILMLTALGTVDHKIEGYDAGADAYMSKPFDLREFSGQVKALIRANTRERSRNPTTDLPGPGAIDDHIAEMLSKGTGVAVLHFEVRDFGSYVDEVGFAQVESFISAVGNMVLDKVRTITAESGFLGHLGATDFIAVVPSDKAEVMAKDVLDEFDANHGQWLKDSSQLAAMAMVAAIASVDGLGRGDSEEVSKRIGAAMKAAKKAPGSRFAVWKP